MEMEFNRKMCHASNEKQKMTNDERNRTTKSRKNQNTQRKGSLQMLGILEVDTIKQVEINK